MTGAPGGRPLRGRWRAGRIGVLGGLSLGLAVGAHTAGGGLLPGPGTLLVLAALLGLAALPLTGRRLRTPGLLAVLTAEQVLLHAVLEAGSVTRCVPLAAGHAGPHGCLTAGPAGSATATGWGMTLAHGLAMLATAWLLARGEAWLWRATERVVHAASPRLRGDRRPPRERVGGRPRTVVVLAPRYAVGGPRAPPYGS